MKGVFYYYWRTWFYSSAADAKYYVITNHIIYVQCLLRINKLNLFSNKLLKPPWKDRDNCFLCPFFILHGLKACYEGRDLLQGVLGVGDLRSALVSFMSDWHMRESPARTKPQLRRGIHDFWLQASLKSIFLTSDCWGRPAHSEWWVLQWWTVMRR